jgi:hypothetical protein
MNITANDSAAPGNHSKHGLISTGLAIITGLATLLLLLVTFTLKSGTPAQLQAGQILFVFALIIAPFPYLTGLVLGIIGAFKKNSKVVFPILGMILNGVGLVIVVVYWLFFLIVVVLFNSLGGWR